jgi:hypothetical protein
VRPHRARKDGAKLGVFPAGVMKEGGRQLVQQCMDIIMMLDALSPFCPAGGSFVLQEDDMMFCPGSGKALGTAWRYLFETIKGKFSAFRYARIQTLEKLSHSSTGTNSQTDPGSADSNSKLSHTSTRSSRQFTFLYTI